MNRTREGEMGRGEIGRPASRSIGQDRIGFTGGGRVGSRGAGQLGSNDGCGLRVACAATAQCRPVPTPVCAVSAQVQNATLLTSGLS